MTLAITGPTNINAVVGLTALATGCKSQLGAIICSFGLALAPCPGTSNCYSANVTTYDLYDPSTNTVPGSAQVLSVADGVVFNVTAGATNSLGFSLSGVPVRLAAVPLDNEATVGATTISLAGVGSRQFFARAYDADGNLITGAGSPLFTIASTPSTNLAVQSSSSNGRFTLQPMAAPAGATVTVQASYLSGETNACSQASAVCSAVYSVIIQQPFTMYTAGFSSIVQEQAIVAGADGNMWFTDFCGNSLNSLTPAGTLTSYAAGIDSGAHPRGIAAGSDGNIWFTEAFVSKIGKITTSGAVTEFSTGITAASNPGAIAAASDGNLWFNELAVPKIARITTAGTITEFPTGLAVATIAITGGPDGNLWFTESHGKIGRMTTTGVVTEFSTGLVAGDEPQYITSGPDGNLWFTDMLGYVGKVSTAGSITEYPVTLPGGASPFFIASGSDGNLWFSAASPSTGAVARITTSGVVTVFNTPAGFSAVAGIAAGYDGNMWFTENTPRAVGKVQI
jgi:virginiamycin B lyase